MHPILDHPVVTERYFFPRRVPIRDPFVVKAGVDFLHGFRLAPHRDAPTLLSFHGHGQVVADWIDWAHQIADRGLNVVLAEYRGYGGSTGTPGLAAMLDDALAFADQIEVPPSDLVVYGRSIGSLYALHVAAHRPVRGLVLESGIAELRDRLLIRLEPAELGVTDEAFDAALDEHFDHRKKLAAYRGPVLILHAEGDHLVAPDHARTFAAWAGDRGQLHIFDQGDHNSIHLYNGEAILDRVVALASGS